MGTMCLREGKYFPIVHGMQKVQQHTCNKLYFFVASLRNFGERTVGIFRRKKNTAEQNAQDLANQTDEAAVSLRNDLKNDTNETAENTGYYYYLLSKKTSIAFIYLYILDTYIYIHTNIGGFDAYSVFLSFIYICQEKKNKLMKRYRKQTNQQFIHLLFNKSNWATK